MSSPFFLNYASGKRHLLELRVIFSIHCLKNDIIDCQKTWLTIVSEMELTCLANQSPKNSINNSKYIFFYFTLFYGRAFLY
jgi:hypothetical protein